MAFPGRAAARHRRRARPLLPAATEGEGLPDASCSSTTRASGTCRSRRPSSDAVAGADRRLYVITPYLADHGILRGLVDAARRGVRRSGDRARRTRTRCRRARPSVTGSGPCTTPVSTCASTRRWPTRRSSCRDDTRPRRDGQPRRAQPAPELGDAAPDRGPRVADHFARELFDRDVTISTPAVMPAGWKDRAVNALMSALAPIL